jgi:hypothetical protein
VVAAAAAVVVVAVVQFLLGATRTHTGHSGVGILEGTRDFHPKCPDWLWNPPSLLFNVYLGSFLGLKLQEPEVDHSPSCIKVKMSEAKPLPYAPLSS